ncbi:MAG TPA: hypothetical protein VJS88_00660 [Chthoniobacterales bacterium]|nr:hypothetical protein [Chthoniobacterales bacterium]
MRPKVLIVRCAFLAMCALAALLPLKASRPAAFSGPLPDWPARWDTEEIWRIPLSDRDTKFAEAFPGRIAKFTNGRREFIFRWVGIATRQLHSSADCFRGAGFTVSPEPAYRDEQGRRWSGFSATRGNCRLRVHERIVDQQGREWTDVSAWFWSVALRQTQGPWFSVTMVEACGHE